MNLEINVEYRDVARVAEGPFWDAPTAQLHWVDILAGEIHTFDTTSRAHTTLQLPTLVGAAIPKSSGGFIAATSDGFAEVGVDGAYETRLTVLPDGQRMNDAKCDDRGRLWAGSTDMSFAAGAGALHVVSPQWQHEQVLSGLCLPNGLGWSPDGQLFYLIDTVAGELCAFDAPGDGLELTNRRLIASFPDGDGMPDGMAVDAAGCLWIAMWGAAKVVRLSPDGERLSEIRMPVQQPSSCAFGGAAGDALYVTSASEGLGLGANADTAPADGSLLLVRGLGVRGRPVARFGG